MNPRAEDMASGTIDTPGAAERLARAFTRYVPGVSAEVGVPAAGQIVLGRDNRAAVERLVATIAARSPEAGRGYWAVRAWGMLTWQPAFLSLLGVHEFGIVPRIGQLGQDVVDAAVLGFRLPAGALGDDRPGDCVPRAGRALRALADGLLADLNGVIAMKPRLAGRLLADRLLGVLLRVGGAGLNPSTVRARASAWLGATALEGESGFLALPLDGGGEALALDRRACCLAYLPADGGLCVDCPRRPLDARIADLAARRGADVHAR